MNCVLILAHNCLEQTKRCVESVLAQDIPTELWVFDSGSTDGTYEWAKNELPKGTPIIHNPENVGVSFGWNYGLEKIFETNEHAFVINNDTVLPKWFCSSLLAYKAPFVTGVSVDSMDAIHSPEPRKELAPCPDFSAYLITKECWEKVGKFDYSMVSYCGDLDFHIRAHRVGVRLWNAGVNFYHERSSTLNNASSREKRTLQMQADADRMRLQEKWGCTAWGPSYAAMFDEKFFGVDVKTACK
jgi:GT2 family glycosyltransferase